MSATHTGITEKVLSFKAQDPIIEPFEPPKDRAFFADPEKKELLSAVAKVNHLTPTIGTELQGIQLSQLSDKQKDELALLVAERGVVFFRDQDLNLEQQHAFSQYLGKQDRDPNQVEPLHSTILGRGGDIRTFENAGSAFCEFHSDHSFEANPPAYTVLKLNKSPETGGDTLWTSQVGLFDTLSPPLQRTLEGFHAVHSSENVFINAINNGFQTLRPPVRREHPLVRTHPVTRLKSLFYNPAFVIRIAELKAAESFHFLNLLREHLHTADDFTVRFRWAAGSIAIWDNRVVAHRAIPGGYNTEEREGKRTTIFGETPFYDAENSETLTQRQQRLNTAPIVKLDLKGF